MREKQHKPKVKFGIYGSIPLFIKIAIVLLTLIAGIIFVPCLWLKIAFAITALLVLILINYMSIYLYGLRDGTKLKEAAVIMDCLSWDGVGKALDVGTGRGLGVIFLARRFPNAKFVGLDIWKDSGGLCNNKKQFAEQNVRVEGISDRVKFVEGTITKMSFFDEEFDALICLQVINNIRTKDHFPIVAEMLRVVKSGGRFAILEPFEWKPWMRDFDGIKRRMKEMGIKEVHSVPLIVKDPSIKFLGAKKYHILYGVK